MSCEKITQFNVYSYCISVQSRHTVVCPGPVCLFCVFCLFCVLCYLVYLIVNEFKQIGFIELIGLLIMNAAINLLI